MSGRKIGLRRIVLVQAIALIMIAGVASPTYARVLGSQSFPDINFSDNKTTNAEMEVAEADLPPAGILPDSPLYVFKRLWETLLISFTFDDAKKTGMHMEFAETRLAEANALTRENKGEYAKKAVEEFNSELNQVKLDVKAKGEIKTRAGNLDDFLAKKGLVLQMVLENVPDDVKPVVENALNNSIEKRVRIKMEVEREERENEEKLKLRAELLNADGKDFGNVDFEKRDDRTKLKVEVEDMQELGFVVGDSVCAVINDANVGCAVLAMPNDTDDGLSGEIKLDSRNNQTIPDIKASDAVSVVDNNGNVILSGVFFGRDNENDETDVERDEGADDNVTNVDVEEDTEEESTTNGIETRIKIKQESKHGEIVTEVRTRSLDGEAKIKTEEKIKADEKTEKKFDAELKREFERSRVIREEIRTIARSDNSGRGNAGDRGERDNENDDD